MADPEKDPGDHVEVKSNVSVAEQQVVQNPSVTKQIDATQSSERTLPAEQEQLTLESSTTEEQTETLDAVTELREVPEPQVQEDVAGVKDLSDDVQSDIDTPAPVVEITAKAVRTAAENLPGLAAETHAVGSTSSGVLGSQKPQVPEDTKKFTTTGIQLTGYCNSFLLPLLLLSCFPMSG